MIKMRKIICMSVFFFLLAGMAFAQGSSFKTYTWQNFQFTYPDHWTIGLDQDNGDTHQVKLLADEAETNSVFLSFIKNFAVPNEEYAKNPVMASISFGLGPALKLAGSYGESAISLSFGSITLTNGPILSARFLISAPEPERTEFYMLECFHVFSEEKQAASFVMLISKGIRGQVIENPAHHQKVAEAYAIARSLLF